jgi:hypothetical protein
MTNRKKIEAFIGGVLTQVDIAAYRYGCQMENGLIGAGYRLKPSSFLYSTGV